MSFRCGYATLVGRPNAGKSTLLNHLLGNKLAITSSKPQTTRDRIVGVLTEDALQAVLIDTPGLHPAWTELNKVMVRRTRDALAEADVLVWLEDTTLLAPRARRNEPIFDDVDREILAMLQASGKPVIFVPNKIDLIERALLLPILDAAAKALPLAAAVPMSAINGDGADGLKAELAKLLPEAPALFPAEVWTEASERFLCGEIIREKIFHHTNQEVPYATHVEIESFDEAEREARDLVRMRGLIVVERPQQKGILIGKGGEMLKRIGTIARHDMERLLGCRVHLELFVKVEKNWTRSAQGLRRVGIRGEV